jgi:hypothetical protein
VLLDEWPEAARTPPYDSHRYNVSKVSFSTMVGEEAEIEVALV